MKLFHYTHPGTYLRIAAEGLLPHAKEENYHMTGGIPVVWLTTETSNVATAQHIAHMTKVTGQADRAPEDLMYGGTARLTVHLDRVGKKLMSYPDFVRRYRPPVDIERMWPKARRSWWVYLGVIPPHKIEPVSAALMLECLSWHIETHPDPEARERFRAHYEMLRARAA